MSGPTTPGPVDAPVDDTTDRWACEAARAAEDKQGEETVVFRVGPVLAVAELFVVTSCSNTRQVRAIAEEVEHRIATLGGPRPRRVEGLDDLRWVLMDYGDFVVHVFLDETRRYYSLERLWSDAPRVEWDTDQPT